MIGIDIASIKRMERFVNRFKKRGLKRFLSKKEIKLAKRIETVAGFWAAKEAVSKALGVGIGYDFGFKDVRVYKNKVGAPKLKFKKRVKEKFGIKNAYISISHEQDIAIAVVIIKRKGEG